MSFTTRSADESFARALRWHLEPFRRAQPEQQAFPVDMFVREEDRHLEPAQFSFFLATSLGYTHPSLVNVLAHALWEINAAVQHRVRDLVLLHSGAVAREGGVLLLPARMDSGKSSLVVGLLEQGWSYLSDEFGAIDPVTGAAFAVPKRISIGWETLRLFPGLGECLHDREGLNAQLPKRSVRPEDLGAGVAAPTEVRWLVFPAADFEGPARLDPMPAAEAVEQMAAGCFNLFRYRDRGVALLARTAQRARAFRLTGGTPRERAELLSETLA